MKASRDSSTNLAWRNSLQWNSRSCYKVEFWQRYFIPCYILKFINKLFVLLASWIFCYFWSILSACDVCLKDAKEKGNRREQYENFSLWNLVGLWELYILEVKHLIHMKHDGRPGLNVPSIPAPLSHARRHEILRFFSGIRLLLPNYFSLGSHNCTQFSECVSLNLTLRFDLSYLVLTRLHKHTCRYIIK